jgi:hypothetical protein
MASAKQAAREEYDRRWDEYVRQVKKLDQLRELAERGEAGERVAARNAIRDQRITCLEWQVSALVQWAILSGMKEG